MILIEIIVTLFLNWAWISADTHCQSKSKVTVCDFVMPKQPVSWILEIYEGGVSSVECQEKFVKFEWDWGLYCDPSQFCAFSANLNQNYAPVFELPEFTPLYDSCQILVDRTLVTCDAIQQKLQDAGILRITEQSCLSGGSSYCQDLFHRECLDVEGGAICNNCSEGFFSTGAPQLPCDHAWKL